MPDLIHSYLFLDMETTDSDPMTCDPWGVAYTIDDFFSDGTVKKSEAEGEYYLFHNQKPTPWVLENTDYLKHFQPDGTPYLGPIFASEFIRHLSAECRSFNSSPIYLVGANVGAFDNVILQRLRRQEDNLAPFYHYRCVDIESMYMSFHNVRAPLGLDWVYENIFGKKRVNSHTAKQDRDDVRKIFYALVFHIDPPA